MAIFSGSHELSLLSSATSSSSAISASAQQLAHYSLMRNVNTASAATSSPQPKEAESAASYNRM